MPLAVARRASGMGTLARCICTGRGGAGGAVCAARERPLGEVRIRRVVRGAEASQPHQGNHCRQSQAPVPAHHRAGAVGEHHQRVGVQRARDEIPGAGRADRHRRNILPHGPQKEGRNRRRPTFPPTAGWVTFKCPRPNHFDVSDSFYRVGLKARLAFGANIASTSPMRPMAQLAMDVPLVDYLLELGKKE